MRKKREFVPKPSRAEIYKIKRSLRIRQNDPLPRCMARSKDAAEKLGPEHQKRGHVCEECRCKHIAGYGTKHYGYGLCFYHEKPDHLQKAARIMADQQRALTMAGYPDKVFKYQTNDEKLSDIREAADAAQGRHQLKEELVVLRMLLQRLLRQIDTRNDGVEDPSELQEIGAADILNVTRLTTTISKLAAIELQVTDSDYVHQDEVKRWIFQVVRAIEELVTNPDEQEALFTRIANTIDPQSGKHHV